MHPVLADVLVRGGGRSRWGPRHGSPHRPRAPAQKGPLTAMQIRLTVVDPLGPLPESQARAASCDVLVTAPAGTALAAVASGLAAAVGSGEGPSVLYAGTERLDAQRCTLGEPPLLDGAVLTLSAPAEPGPEPDADAPQLHVVAGPDAGGVHLLHGGAIRIGRSADAEVPLDDPDVSRLHCAITLTADGSVSVADLNSTNGTVLDGSPVTDHPMRFAPGALLRIGESALRLTLPGRMRPMGTAPDGEGRVRVLGEEDAGDPAQAAPSTSVPRARGEAARGRVPAPPGHPDRTPIMPAPTAPARPAACPATRITATASPPGAPRAGPSQERRSRERWSTGPRSRPPAGSRPRSSRRTPASGEVPRWLRSCRDRAEPPDREPGPGRRGMRKGTPPRGTDVPPGVRRRGFTAWARRLTGGRGDQSGIGRGAYDADGGASVPAFLAAATPEKWPDPAALLLAVLGPGPRLWERGPGHPETLTVRLGTADRAAPDGSGLLPAVPVTAGLREVGSLGLAGPRERLAGLARVVVAQLAALHSPDMLELVLISADRSRPLEERTADWSWLGWLPHLRPAHGQDCRLLLAYDREQAAARTDELLRRLEDHLTDQDGLTGPPRGTAPGRRSGTAGESPGAFHHPADPGNPALDPQGASSVRGAARRPSWVRDDDPAGGALPGPYTVVVVDGDPGGAAVREAVVRLAHQGPRAGIHVICLAEAPPASPASPMTATYEAACATSPAFRECGAVALLSGDVATALRLLRVAPGEGTDAAHGLRAPVGHGTVAAVDAVSPAWAERFARALAPCAPTAAGSGTRVYRRRCPRRRGCWTSWVWRGPPRRR
ncbi:FHA domain-containing protein [Streptomyces chiangmaiensis]